VICNYCGQRVDDDFCEHCGGRNGQKKLQDEIQRGEPFYYEGYIVWALREIQSDAISYVFYRGREIVDKIRITGALLRARFIDGESEFSFIWNLFLLSQGLTDAVVQRQSVREPQFITIRLESEEETWAKNMTNEKIEELISCGKAIVMECV